MKNLDFEIKWDEHGLVPAIVQDQATGQVLMLAYMNQQALKRTLETGQTHFWSRSRGELWHKGATSGNTQTVRHIHYDCDADTLLISVDPAGPACHTGEQTCFFRELPASPVVTTSVVRQAAEAATTDDSAEVPVVTASVVPQAAEAATTDDSTEVAILTKLFAVIGDRKANPRPGSYTARLFAAGPTEIAKKLGEEAIETIVASAEGDREQLIYEAADVIYHLLVLLAQHEVSLDEVLIELERRRRQ